MAKAGWLTPNNIPVGDVVLEIAIPDSGEWRSALYGALLLLSDPANWEKFGTLTPEETADEWRGRVLDAIASVAQ